MKEYLLAFDHRALIVEPAAERSGYSFAPLDLETRSFSWGQDDALKDQVRALLPPAGARCSRCSASAPFTWCGLDIFEGSPFELTLRPRGAFAESPLCGSCAAAALEKSLRGAGVVYPEVLPPADADGALIPGEY